MTTAVTMAAPRQVTALIVGDETGDSGLSEKRANNGRIAMTSSSPVTRLAAAVAMLMNNVTTRSDRASLRRGTPMAVRGAMIRRADVVAATAAKPAPKPATRNQARYCSTIFFPDSGANSLERSCSLVVHASESRGSEPKSSLTLLHVPAESDEVKEIR